MEAGRAYREAYQGDGNQVEALAYLEGRAWAVFPFEGRQLHKYHVSNEEKTKRN